MPDDEFTLSRRLLATYICVMLCMVAPNELCLCWPDTRLTTRQSAPLYPASNVLHLCHVVVVSDVVGLSLLCRRPSSTRLVPFLIRVEVCFVSVCVCVPSGGVVGPFVGGRSTYAFQRLLPFCLSRHECALMLLATE